MKKDLSLYTGSPLSRMFDLNRFGDMFDTFDKLWKNWDIDYKMFTDLQPKSAFPKVNVVETDEAYEVDIALAGFSKDEVSLEFVDNCLCIKADKQVEEKEEDKKYLMKEISSRSFRRALSFVKKVDTTNIESSYDSGVVRCTLKKLPEINPKDDTVKIEIL